jgi:beta-phosphoglucomutase-like phosphatase (HAD superfamily)
LEDALKGLNAANEAGMPCIILQNELNRNIDFKNAEMVFPSLADFVSALQE